MGDYVFVAVLVGIAGVGAFAAVGDSMGVDITGEASSAPRSASIVAAQAASNDSPDLIPRVTVAQRAALSSHRSTWSAIAPGWTSGSSTLSSATMPRFAIRLGSSGSLSHVLGPRSAIKSVERQDPEEAFAARHASVWKGQFDGLTDGEVALKRGELRANLERARALPSTEKSGDDIRFMEFIDLALEDEQRARDYKDAHEDPTRTNAASDEPVRNPGLATMTDEAIDAEREGIRARFAELNGHQGAFTKDERAEYEGLLWRELGLATEQVARGQRIIDPYASLSPDADRRMHSAGGIIFPLASFTWTSPFGVREDPMHAGTQSGHTGLDLMAPLGTRIDAAADGTVVSAGWNGGYGNMVILAHPDGTQTRYGHMSGFSVSQGQQVAAGQQIGVVGSTGQSTGPHLHFEVIDTSGALIDPAPLLGLDASQLGSSHRRP